MGGFTPYNLKAEWKRAKTMRERFGVVLLLVVNVPYHIMILGALGFTPGIIIMLLLGRAWWPLTLIMGTVLTTLIFVDFWGFMWRGKVYGLLGQKYMAWWVKTEKNKNKEYLSMCRRAGIL